MSASIASETERTETTSRLRAWGRELASVLVFAAILLAARSSLADHYYVPTGSMIPTVAVGDHLIVNKAAYGVRIPFSDLMLARRAGPQRGDVVVLRSPENGIILLKRVVAVPGDVVSVLNGQVWINGLRVPTVQQGEEIIEQLGQGKHAVRLTRGGGLDYGPVTVGDGRYLVMGDNRGDSHDGRAFGLVARDAIYGKALAVWLREGSLCWRGL